MRSNNKPIVLYQCPICGDFFNTKAQCLEHMKTHDGEREVAIVSLFLCADGWKISKSTKRLSKGLQVGNVVFKRDVNSWHWHIEVENDEASILDAKRRLKATALRWYRGQARRLAKLEIEEKAK